MSEVILQVKDLVTCFDTGRGMIRAVDGVDISVEKGSIVGIVGESGCGKSMLARSVMGLVRSPGEVSSGELLLDGRDLLKMKEKELASLRGSELSMIFQEPMTSLNPVIPVGRQVMEALRLHRKIGRREAKKEVLEIFQSVGIPEAERRFASYPHQLSGGLRQRVMIAMAMVCKPKLLIADEPTTALDVTVEAQILRLLKKLRDTQGTSMIMISHDLGVIAQLCDYVYVMYAGRVVEQAAVEELFSSARHPYTQGLLRSVAALDTDCELLDTIPGMVPDLASLPQGCAFGPRCDRACPGCGEAVPPLVEVSAGHLVRCYEGS